MGAVNGPKVYATEAEAFRRAEILTRSGVWPGVVACEGGFRLTADPDDTPRPHRAAGEEA